MNVTYESKNFSEDKIVSRYARRFSNGEIKFYDVDNRGRTIREYWCRDEDADPIVVARCRDAGYEMVRI